MNGPMRGVRSEHVQWYQDVSRQEDIVRPYVRWSGNRSQPVPRKELETEHIRSQAQGVLDPSSPIITPWRAHSTYLESFRCAPHIQPAASVS